MSVVIIGSGLSGQLVLKGLREKGYQGQITMLSEHPADFYAKPSLSNLTKQNKQARDLIQMTADEVAKKYSATIKSGVAVTKIDRNKKQVWVADECVAYDQLVLAVGAVPRVLSILPQDERIFRVNDLWAYEVFEKKLQADSHLVILGGGLIGCEFANDLSSRVDKLTILEPTDALMSKMIPKEMGKVLQQQLEKIGVDIKLAGHLGDIQSTDTKLKIGWGEEVINADILLAAIGMQPDITLAQQAGLEVDQGVLINDFAQTSDSDIYALGDCAQSKWGVRYYVAPLRVTASVIVDQLLNISSKLVFPPMPVMMKTPAYPICFCIEKQATSWEVKQEGDSIKALGYLENELVSFAVSGIFLSGRLQLKQQLQK
ncbi:FAD-dependent oxidoreductase [Gammaproteobacteria bacterium]|nr:FAD-dependent oxidoreductase [Gammaproteobacteria bacterium]